VIGIIQTENSRKLVRLGWQFCVQDSRITVQALQNASFPAHIKSLTGS
jgi:DNA polymerase III subunit alpha